MISIVRKTILSYLLLCLVAQGLLAQAMVMQVFPATMEMCHTMDSMSLTDMNADTDTDVDENTFSQNQSLDQSTAQNQSNCCTTDCDMGNCFSALIPTSYRLHSLPFPVSVTAYLAPLSDSQAVSLFRPPITF